MMKSLAVAFLLLLSLSGLSQTDSSRLQPPLPAPVTSSPLRISAYAELYYSYDFSAPSDHQRPGFMYSHNRHHEVNLNLGLIQAAYRTASVRANLALMAGTYAQANLASEPGVLKHLFEANAGVKLSRKKDLWLDAGIFASHLGFESAIGKECWNLTRSMAADNSPYYESGVKLGYRSGNGKWLLSLLYLNGWQRIQRPDDYNTPAFGHQLTYSGAALTLNSSSFIGSDTPDSTQRMRYFHNLYGIFQLHPRWGIIAGLDMGAQQAAKHSNEYDLWYSPVLIVRWKATDRLYVAARGEYYRDEKGVIVATGSPHGFQTSGWSLNLDYALQENFIWRVEGRMFNSKDPLFLLHGRASRDNYAVTTALAVSF